MKRNSFNKKIHMETKNKRFYAEMFQINKK